MFNLVCIFSLVFSSHASASMTRCPKIGCPCGFRRFFAPSLCGAQYGVFCLFIRHVQFFCKIYRCLKNRQLRGQNNRFC
nr:MAG TPA: hypothetical protein [Caudoviricetes sp.]